MYFDDHIHTGGWVNWSHNAAFGRTITLSSRSAFFLVSFLTLYVAIAGSRFWLLVAFIIHQEIASRKQYDGMHIQQQTILRNSEAPFSAAISLVMIALRWRGVVKRPILRSLPLVLLALISLGAFRAASILTAEVIKSAGNETLIDSPGCGYWEPDSDKSVEQGAWRTKLTADAFAAASYSRACYSGNFTGLAQCELYMKQKLSWNGTFAAQCPYSSDLCFPSPSAVYQMDTGQLDSHSDLGLNAAKKNRIAYRRLTTCAPINATKFVSSESDGSIYNYNLGHIDGYYDGDLSFVYHNSSIEAGIGYQLTALSTEANAEWVTEISNGHTDQADVTIAFITANAVAYDNQNTDLVFSATKPEVRDGQSTFYLPDNPVSVLGCVDQHQFCLPSTSQCSDLSKVERLVESAQTLNLNPKQNATVGYIYNALFYSGIYRVVSPRGATALQAGESVFQNYAHQLSDKQWVIEVGGWFEASLARLQQSMVEIAAGPPAPQAGVKYTKPGSLTNDPNAESLCRAQILRSSGRYQNLSVLGVAIILAFSTFLIWLGSGIGAATGWVQRFIHRGEDRRLQWLLDDSLQLQRMAYVGAGEGTWPRDPEAIPITHQAGSLRASRHLPANHRIVEELTTPAEESQTPKHS